MVVGTAVLFYDSHGLKSNEARWLADPAGERMQCRLGDGTLRVHCRFDRVLRGLGGIPKAKATESFACLSRLGIQDYSL